MTISVTNINPAPPATLPPSHRFMFDVTFSPPESQGIVLITLAFDGNPAELVFDGTGFTAAYAGGSTKTALGGGGYQFKLYRSGGWPSQPTISVQEVTAELDELTDNLETLDAQVDILIDRDIDVEARLLVVETTIDTIEISVPSVGTIVTTQVRPPDAAASLAEPAALVTSGGRCHAADIGVRPWANATHDAGICATSTSGEAAGYNHRYGDQRAGYAEGQWIAAETTHFGTPGARTPDFWRIHTGTNPATGEHVAMLLDGKKWLALKSGLGDIALEPGASKPVGYILSGPNGGMRERKVGNSHQINGAGVISILPATILNTDIVPYSTNRGARTFASCRLIITARDSPPATWERYECEFDWVGGRTVAQGGAVASIVTDIRNIDCRKDGAIVAVAAIGGAGSGKRVTIEEDGLGVGGIVVKFNGVGGVNFLDVTAKLIVDLPV